ncbi:Pre-mRNA-processing factor like [Actinidia chinensis var. chinensis]|uniref:Pre-mRNA-processing factor like n=1 Tax=Actinidia chinensis var. chinensis TaxID=1590841 RepID=A0A2R6Q6R3_ACTCC|nr:Pre-mRNA-processing factor like [Actinidia chinensis var. chinensis]
MLKDCNMDSNETVNCLISQGYNLLALSGGFDEQLQELIRRGSLDFDTWTSIISNIERTFPENIERICSVYDSFLSEFPLCHGYWRKYAAHKAHLCTLDKVVEIFERAVQSATYCVGVWVEYCSFGMLAYKDPSDVRRLFKRALSFVGKDFLCHPLWDKYIEFEFSQQQWSFLAQICVQTLKFPTKRLHRYYDNFKKFVAILEEEMKLHDNCSIEIESESVSDAAVPMHKDEVSGIINSLVDPSTGSFNYKALQKYISIGESFYQEACEVETKIHCFENNIQRPYFHVLPLDDNQLENWHRYLNFIERQEDFDWAVKLYERCLIPCAIYPEFWMRYVEFMETKGGREIANFALDRATKIFLKNVPAIHVFNARFKEQIGDRYGARAAYLWSDDESSSHFIEKVINEANMEKRLGNFAAASSVYEKALAVAAERQKLHSVPILYIHFSRLKYMMAGSIDAARDVIIDGIQRVPHCKLLLEGLIHFLMMHGGPGQLNVVDNIIDDAISSGSEASQGLGAKEREDISILYLEFVDQCGTVHDIRKAWNRHIKLFPHLIRTTSSNKLPTSGIQLLDMMGGRRKNPFPMSSRPSGGHSPNQLIQLQMPQQRLSLPDNDAIQPDQFCEDQFQPEDKDNSAQDQPQQLSLKTGEQSVEDAFGVNKSTHDSIIQSEDDASGQMESTPYVVHQSREDASEPVESTHDLVHESGEDACEPIESTPYLVHQSREDASDPVESTVHESGEDACGPIESTPGLVQLPGEDACEPMELTHEVVHQPREDAPGPIEPSNDLVHQVADDEAFPNASQEYSDPTNVEQEQEQDQEPEPEQHLKPLPLDGLPLNSQDKEYGDSTPMSSYENRSPTTNRVQDNCQTANESPSIVSPGSTRSPDSVQIQNESSDSAQKQNESVNPSFEANHQNPPPVQAQPEPREPTDGASRWHHIDNTVQVSGNARSVFHGNLQDKQNQRGQVTPQQQRPQAEMGAWTLTSLGYSHHPLPGQNPQVQQDIQTQNQDQVGPARGKSTVAHFWPTQNLQQQNLVSVHQPQPDSVPASHSSAQMPQFPMQSGGQFGNAGYNQAYNQMMENYFRQQQMMAQQHYNQQQQFTQQLQQIQQPYQQKQHLLQPYQQYELYAQQQQQMAQFYYQQLPQMQEQQAQMMWQQLQNAHQQQDQLYYQYMQQQQAYQQSQQQYQMQQQQGYEQLQQQQGYQQVLPQQQPQQQQQEELQMQQPSFYQQVMPPHSASASRNAQSPHPQQQSQGIRPPHCAAAASGSAVTPHQTSRGVSPRCASPSGPPLSPYNKQ